MVMIAQNIFIYNRDDFLDGYGMTSHKRACEYGIVKGYK